MALPCMATVVTDRAGPPWHWEHFATLPKNASLPRCCAAVTAKRLRSNLLASFPGGNSCANMKASIASFSAVVGRRKSGGLPGVVAGFAPGAVPVALRAKLLGDRKSVV